MHKELIHNRKRRLREDLLRIFNCLRKKNNERFILENGRVMRTTSYRYRLIKLISTFITNAGWDNYLSDFEQQNLYKPILLADPKSGRYCVEKKSTITRNVFEKMTDHIMKKIEKHTLKPSQST